MRHPDAANRIILIKETLNILFEGDGTTRRNEEPRLPFNPNISPERPKIGPEKWKDENPHVYGGEPNAAEQARRDKNAAEMEKQMVAAGHPSTQSRLDKAQANWSGFIPISKEEDYIISGEYDPDGTYRRVRRNFEEPKLSGTRELLPAEYPATPPPDSQLDPDFGESGSNSASSRYNKNTMALLGNKNWQGLKTAWDTTKELFGKLNDRDKKVQGPGGSLEMLDPSGPIGAVGKAASVIPSSIKTGMTPLQRIKLLLNFKDQQKFMLDRGMYLRSRPKPTMVKSDSDDVLSWDELTSRLQPEQGEFSREMSVSDELKNLYKISDQQLQDAKKRNVAEFAKLPTNLQRIISTMTGNPLDPLYWTKKFKTAFVNPESPAGIKTSVGKTKLDDGTADIFGVAYRSPEDSSRNYSVVSHHSDDAFRTAAHERGHQIANATSTSDNRAMARMIDTMQGSQYPYTIPEIGARVRDRIVPFRTGRSLTSPEEAISPMTPEQMDKLLPTRWFQNNVFLRSAPKGTELMRKYYRTYIGMNKKSKPADDTRMA